MFRHSIILVLLVAAFVSPAPGVDTLQVSSPDPVLEGWRWTTFDRSSGLAGRVWNIFEDRDGNVWFATDRGAQRYDGINWTTYTTEDGLAHNQVRVITQTRDGAMWFGTGATRAGRAGGRGISRFDGETWTTYTTADGLATNNILAKGLLQARDGTLWAGFWSSFADTTGTQAGISRFDGETWTLVEVPVGAPRPGILDIHQASDGALWFTTFRHGVLRFDGTGWTRYTAEDGLAGNFTAEILESRDGSLWVGFADAEGISRFDGREWRTYTARDGLPEGVRFNTLWQTEDGTVWAGGSWGSGVLSRFDGERWKPYASEEIPQVSGNVRGVPMRDGAVWIYDFGADKAFRFDYTSTKRMTFTHEERLSWGYSPPDGSVWFGTRSGAVRYDGENWVRYTSKNGLLDAPIYGMNQTDDGSLWFFAGEREKFEGVNRYHNGSWRRYPAQEVGLDDVADIIRAKDGSFWFAGAKNGRSAASRYDGRTWRVYTDRDGLVGWQLNLMLQAANGDLWFSVGRRFKRGRRIDEDDDDGVLQYDGKAWTSYTTEDGLAHNRIYGLFQTPDGTIWVGTRAGLSWFDSAGWHSYTLENGLPAQKPRGFVVSNGDLWFCYQADYGAGVTRYNGKTWRTYTVQDGLVDNRVESIYRAMDGTLWFGTMGGISRFDGTSWASYTADDGLPDDHIRRIWQSSDGTLWFRTAGGKAGTFTPDMQAPETTIEPALTEISSAGNILLRWSGRDLWDGTPSRDLRYQWRVDGGKWSPPSERTDFTLASLSSGRHSFEARAVDRDMNTDPTPAVHAFVVEPPWWKNPWVIGVTVVLLGGIGFQTGRVVRRDRRLQEANRELDDSNQALSSANKELFQANQALQRDHAVERIRGEVQAMEQASDFEKVLSLLSEDLKAVGLSFDTCGIDVLDEPVDKPAMEYFEEHGFLYTTYTIDPEGIVTRESYQVSAPFPPVNRETIERFIAGEPWQALIGGTNAILEVPASNYGRLRITSSERQDFTEEDTDALRDFASAIALGYARYLDIREIQEQTERKSAFMASMSHEIRTPMNAIIGFTRMVLRRSGDVLPERQKDNLHKVQASADHLLNLINSILDLSKIEAGRVDVEPERFDVKNLIVSCCATVNPLVKPGVELKQDAPDTIGEANTDQGRLRQILINLLSNALKFTEQGEVSVRTSKANGHLIIAVSGTGTGIPADALETIFEEFQQVKGSDPQHKGTGLGLPITKGFAELLGGSIGVQSEIGKGSTFTVRVPLVYSQS